MATLQLQSHAVQTARRVRLSLALVSALSLFALYFYFLDHFLNPITMAPMDGIETTIFYTMIFRVLGLSFVPFLRRLHPQIKILIFSLEAFVLCFLIVGVIFSGSTGYNSILAEVLTTWLGTTLIVLTPYSIYELTLMMLKTPSITSLVVSATPLLAITLFLANLVARIPNPSGGLSTFGSQLIFTLKAQPGLGSGTSNTAASTNAFISSFSVLFFLSMIIYISYSLNQSDLAQQNASKQHYALALMLIGTLFLFVWLVAISSLKGNIFEVFSIPSIAIPIVLLVISRGD